jgi:hypothetical protein
MARHRATAIESLEIRRLLSTTWYVDAAASGATQDGTSWNTAYTDLQQALSSAAAGDAIHVAQGTYKPTSTTDRTISFQLKNGVEIDGGYAGSTSATPDARDVEAYSTILSGDVGISGDRSDNTYHVVRAINVDATAVLSGFTITGGNTWDDSLRNGGGMYISGGSPDITHCTFSANSALSGGGLADEYGSDPVLDHCTFLRNHADTIGGGLSNDNYGPESSADLIDSLFLGNSAASSGGAIGGIGAVTLTNCILIGNVGAIGGAIWGVPGKLTNCTFTGNISRNNPGGALNGCDGAVTNCMLWNDRGAGAESEIYNSNLDSPPAVMNSDIQGGYAGTGNIDADPLFYRDPSPGADGTWGTADDDYGDLRLLPNSPCIDAGSNSAVPAGVTTDLAGNPRIFDFPGVNDPGAIVDMGAYEANTNLGAMHLTAGQNVVLPAGGYGFSLSQLTIDPGATLDVKDDDLILPDGALGTWTGSSYDGVTGMIKSGAIFSSSAQSKLTTLGVATAGDALSISGSQTALFDGQTVSPSDILVKFTYVGDANLDGKVNIDDYGRIDGNVAQSGNVFGWFNGDFNLDGKINIDDYGLIDGVIGMQGPVL